VIGMLAGKELRVGKTRVVVDRQVQVLPAGPARALRAVAEHRLADREEAPEALDGHVQELSRALPLVAGDWPAHQEAQARGTVAAEHLPHRRGGPAEERAADERAGVGVGAGLEDLRLGARRETARPAPGHRPAIGERHPATRLEAAPEPVAGRTACPDAAAAACGLLPWRMSWTMQQRDSKEKRIRQVGRLG
jgi:hypothetical protein